MHDQVGVSEGANQKSGVEMTHSVRSRRLLATVSAVLAVSVFAALAPAAAQASGSSYSHAQYQVTLSLNCNDPTAACQNVMASAGRAWSASADRVITPGDLGVASRPMRSTAVRVGAARANTGLIVPS
jgi:hypothetical protein